MTTTETFNLLEPYQIADETFVIPWALEAPPVGHFPMNSMVIRGAEPVLVDTGAPAVRRAVAGSGVVGRGSGWTYGGCSSPTTTATTPAISCRSSRHARMRRC